MCDYLENFILDNTYIVNAITTFSSFPNGTSPEQSSTISSSSSLKFISLMSLLLLDFFLPLLFFFFTEIGTLDFALVTLLSQEPFSFSALPLTTN